MRNKYYAIMVVLCVLTITNISTSVLAASQESNIIIGYDDEKDLQMYTYDYMDDEVLYPSSTNPETLYDELDEMYGDLDKEWGTDDKDIGEPAESPGEVDIVSVKIKHLDKNIASIYLNFRERPQESQYGFFFFIWTDYADERLIIAGLYSPPGMFDWFYGAVYYNDDDYVPASLDMYDKTIRISIVSENFELKEKGDFKAATYSPDLITLDYYWDVFDVNQTEQVDYTWLYMILIFIAVGIAAIVAYFVITKKKPRDILKN